jgi:hypothetical protein
MKTASDFITAFFVILIAIRFIHFIMNAFDDDIRYLSMNATGNKEIVYVFND